jgi:cytoskeleton protein RodZ
MTEPDATPAPASASAPAGATTAGALLRQAREARGLHIATLAATMKVAPNKLEALEADRYDELPDLTFTRALAQAMCRTLKIDVQTVLALLPRAPAPAGLERVASGLNTPFRDQADRSDPWAMLLSRGPLVWGGAVLLLAALAVYFMPAGNWFARRAADAAELPASAAASAAAASAASADLPLRVASSDASANTNAGATPAAPETGASGSVSASAAAVASVPAADVADGLAVVRVQAPSWVEVRDGRDAVLLARTLQAGESVGLNGALPLRFKIGNAAVTELRFRGQPVNLAAATRDNIARLELK